MTISLFLLSERAVLRLSGKDSIALLQGLVSNDVNQIKSNNQPIWTALLTPQGKFLHEFFIIPFNDALYLDVSTARKEDLLKRLQVYKLRSDVKIEDVSDQWQIGAILDDLAIATPQPTNWGLLYQDPRLALMGWRCLIQQPLPKNPSWQHLIFFYSDALETYHQHRIQQGIPDGDRDLPIERAILLENGFEELHGINWDKGCYMGQELMARTHHRGLVRKRLLPVYIEGPVPEPGTEIIINDEKWGVMQGAEGPWGLALLYVEKVRPLVEAKGAINFDKSRLTPYKPDWLIWPESNSQA